MQKITNGIDACNEKDFCIIENDGIALCVCKHRPCEKIAKLQQENLEYIKLYNAEVKKNEQLLREIRFLQVTTP